MAMKARIYLRTLSAFHGATPTADTESVLRVRGMVLLPEFEAGDRQYGAPLPGDAVTVPLPNVGVPECGHYEFDPADERVVWKSVSTEADGSVTLTMFPSLTETVPLDDAARTKRSKARTHIEGVLTSPREASALRLALISAFRADLDREAFAELDPLPALSGLLLEWPAYKPGALPPAPGQITVNRGGTSVRLETEIFADAGVKRSGAPRVAPLRLELTQKAQGVLLRVHKSDRETLAATEIGEGRATFIRVRRGFGPLASLDAPVLSQGPLEREVRTPPSTEGDSVVEEALEWDAFDQMSPTDHVGEQLHYVVELLDDLVQVVGRGTALVMRQRLDPPLAAAKATCTMKVDLDDTGRIRQRLAFHVDVTDQADGVQPVLFVEQRPLDACGFYGDDDDLALLEGLREADIAGPPEPRTAPVTSAQRERWRGAFATLGLRRSHATLGWTFTKTATGGSWASEGQGLLDDIVAGMEPRQGYCFQVALERTSTSVAGPESRVLSDLRECQHRLEIVRADKTIEQELFQVEKILASPGDRYVDASDFALGVEAATPEDASRRIWVDFRQPQVVPGSEVPAGGIRLLARDVVGVHDPAPFEEVAFLQTLPEFVLRYRPLSYDPTAWRTKPIGETLLPLASAAAVDEGSAKADISVLDTFADRLRQESVQSYWRGWLHSPSTHARVDPPDAEALAVLQEAVSKAEKAGDSDSGAGHWPVLAAFLAFFAGLGLARDLVVKRSGLPELESVLKRVCAEDAFKALMVIAAYPRPSVRPPLADPTPLATVRLLVAPPSGWLTGGLATTWDTLAKAGRLRGLTPSPDMAVQDVMIGDFRRVEFDWAAPRDRWHHDIEVCLQVLDRYARVRRLIADPGASLPDARRVPSRSVTLPRLEAVSERVSVIPRLDEPTTVAFDVADPRERLLSSAGALVQVRLGRLELRHALRGDLSRVPEYFGVDGKGPLEAWAREVGAQHLGREWERQLPRRNPKAPPPTWELSLGWSEEADGIVWTPAPPAPSAGRRAGHTDSLRYVDLPYYLDYLLDSRLIADAQVGPTTTVSHRRRPAQLSVPTRPRFSVRTGDEAVEVTVSLELATLQSHLTANERAKLTGAYALTLGDVAEARGRLLPDDLGRDRWDIPLHLMPDLDVVYHLFLNVAAPSATSLVPFMDVRRRADGPLERTWFEVALVRPVGFRGTGDSPELTAPGMLGVHVSGKATAGGAMAAALATFRAHGRSALRSPFWLTVQRGGLVSSPLPLEPDGGVA